MTDAQRVAVRGPHHRDIRPHCLEPSGRDLFLRFSPPKTQERRSAKREAGPSADAATSTSTSTAAGVDASTAAAPSATPGPDHRRTAACSNATEATPISACGTSIDQDENPKTRPDCAITHNADAG